MVTKKVNVLVYSGTGSTVESVKHCLYTLRRLLSPNYAVIPVTETAIVNEPWTASCALLVFPGGADLAYCRAFNGTGNARIDQYVRWGGAYLGLCAGGYYGSTYCQFEVGDKKLEVAGRRELAFFPGICRGCAFKGFEYHSEAGARAVELKVNKEAFASGVLPKTFRSYYNGGGVFVNAGKLQGNDVEVLASYTEKLDVDGGDDGHDAAAVVYCKIGAGGAVLTGPHPEFAAVNLDPKSGGTDYAKVVDAIKEDDTSRTNFMKACLMKLGLNVAEQISSVPSLSRLHLSSLNHTEVPELLEDLKEIITIEDGEEYIKGANDTFHIEKQNSRWSLNEMKKTLDADRSSDDSVPDQAGIANMTVNYNAITKRLITHESEWPGAKETPYFNHHAFFANLKQYQGEKSSEAEDYGKLLLYGEVVTSTNTMLEKNTALLERLPPGFTATATIQVAGRGRGSNVWVSPAGCLIWSTCLTHPMALSNKAPVVFIQYLMAIAIVQGIHSYDHGYDKIPVKLKWPNDIYAQDPSKVDSKEYVKIGGILVNSSYSSNAYNLVVGVGLNTSNVAPTTALNSLLPPHLAPFTQEKLLARILTTFETIYKSFLRTGFDTKLEKQYYSYWLHTGQIVTLESVGGSRGRVLGITRDWGLLKVQRIRSEGYDWGEPLELQSDSNSFDFFKGLAIQAQTAGAAAGRKP